LAFPTILEGKPDKKHRVSTLIAGFKRFKAFIETIIKNADVVERSFLKNEKFDFFHIQGEEAEGIKPSS